MADNPVRHIADDGSIYTAEAVPPKTHSFDAKYRVDLVRESVDEYGLGREQRLTVAQYNSWSEAEEHLHEVEDGLAENGLAGLGENAQRLQEQPFVEEVFYMAVTYPPDAPENNNPSAAHMLAISEKGVASATLAVGEREEVERVVGQVDTAFAEEGIDAALLTAQREAEHNDSRTPTTPLFDPDEGTMRHVDGGGTAHWFAVVERNEPENDPYELRYFRSLEMDDGTQRGDSYPVMPLPDDDPGSAWPLPGLETSLNKGDVYMAQQFAHDVADAYGQDFPDPLDLPSFDPHPEYYFGYGVGPNNEPSLEAVKTWMDGTERCFDTLTVGEYCTFDEAAVDERELETLLDEQRIEAAMSLAESMAVAGGYLDPNRDDPRIFFEDGAPPDMFMTNRQRELNIPSYGLGAISADGESFLGVLKTWGEDNHERLVIPQPDWETAVTTADVAGDLLESGQMQEAMRLLEVAGIEAGVIDPERDNPRLFTQGPLDPFQTVREEEIDDGLARYGVTWRESYEWATEAEQIRKDENLAVTDEFELILDGDDNRLLSPLDSTVNYAVVVNSRGTSSLELAVEKVWKGEGGDVEIASQTIQTYDPDDERELAQADRDALLEVYDERGLEAMMHKAELQAMQNGYLDTDRVDTGLFREGPPDRFETLAQQLEGEINPYWNTDGEVIDDPEPDQQAQNPHWRLDALPVNNLDGEPLGHALHMVVYDSVEHNPEAVGSPEMPEDEPFSMLEMAHFETTEAADKFGKEFNGYLRSGLLEGPELAEEVARLEELPVNWKTLEGQELADYRNLNLTLTRNPADWYPYNPNAERDARIEAEGLYTDLIHKVIGGNPFTTFDEDCPKIEPAAPNFDL